VCTRAGEKYFRDKYESKGLRIIVVSKWEKVAKL
jgi:hypothetical protein